MGAVGKCSCTEKKGSKFPPEWYLLSLFSFSTQSKLIFVCKSTGRYLLSHFTLFSLIRKSIRIKINHYSLFSWKQMIKDTALRELFAVTLNMRRWHYEDKEAPTRVDFELFMCENDNVLQVRAMYILDCESTGGRQKSVFLWKKWLTAVGTL